MRNKTMTLVLICSSVIILIGVIVGFATLGHNEERENTTKIAFSEDKTEGAIQFRDMLLHPGESIDYTVLMTNELEGECKLGISFKEHKPNLLANELKKFVYVTVTLDGVTLCENILLEDMFDTEIPLQDCVLEKREPVELHIVFHMPVDTGNEAQYTEALFDVLLNVSNE